MSHEGERESASEGAALGEEKRENRKFNIGLCFRNMKLFLLFKYETEIEIDSPSGGQWTTREEAERNTKKKSRPRHTKKDEKIVQENAEINVYKFCSPHRQLGCSLQNENQFRFDYNFEFLWGEMDRSRACYKLAENLILILDSLSI